MNIDELERLLQLAAPLPWLIQSDEPLAIVNEARLYRVEIAEVRTGFTEPFDAEQRASAALIVAAVNALPALIACVKTADDMRALRQNSLHAYDAARKVLAGNGGGNG